MKAVLHIARQEILICLRNRWVFAMTAVMLLLAVSLVLLGSGPTGSVGVDPLSVLSVSLSSLSVFLVPLLALLVTYDTIVGESENGTMLLLLSYPVSRSQVIFGKFLGLWAITVFAILIGFGTAAAALAFGQDDPLPGSAFWSFSQLILSACLLGAIFLAFGIFASTLANQRGTAAAMTIGLWLLFVVIFDLILLGGLILGLDAVLSEEVLSTLLLMNPTDVFRILNTGNFTETGLLSGTATLAGHTANSASILWGSLILWILIPLGSAIYIFKRKEI